MINDTIYDIREYIIDDTCYSPALVCAILMKRDMVRDVICDMMYDIGYDVWNDVIIWFDISKTW